MQIPKPQRPSLQRAFTLIELLTAMAITAILVVLIMQLTNQSVRLWKVMREDTVTAGTARAALQIICQDLESAQIRADGTEKEWFYAEVDKKMTGLPNGLKKDLPQSARIIFFTCPPDRNPAVGATSSQRGSYRSILASNVDLQGDVSAVGYRLLFRDQVLNVSNRNGDSTIFPLFSLYRNVVTPRDTFEQVLGRNDLQSAYAHYASDEEKNFLCENIVDLSIVLHVEYSASGGGGANNQEDFTSIAIPILATKNGSRNTFRLYGNYASAHEQGRMESARIVSAQVAITVLTEEGVALVQQVRLGQRRAPNLKEFYTRYTRSYSRTVTLPLPL